MSDSTVAAPPPWEARPAAAAHLGAARGRRARPRAAPCCAGSAAGAATRRCSSGTSTGSPCSWPRSCAPTTATRRRPRCATSTARPTCSPGSATRSSCAASAPCWTAASPTSCSSTSTARRSTSCSPARPLALEQLLPLGLHVASALHYLAAEGVVHLDVKPSNIVMGGPPRLIDLSVARTVDEAARAAHPDRHRRLHGPRAVRARRPPRPAGRRLRPRGHALHRPHRHAPVRGRARPLAAADRRPRRCRAAPRPRSPPSCAPAWTPTRPPARPRASSRARSSRSSPLCRSG